MLTTSCNYVNCPPSEIPHAGKCEDNGVRRRKAADIFEETCCLCPQGRKLSRAGEMRSFTSCRIYRPGIQAMRETVEMGEFAKDQCG